MKRLPTLCMAIVVLASALACSPLGSMLGRAPTPTPTKTPKPPTATPSPTPPVPTDTSIPTATPVPIPTDTPVPTATPAAPPTPVPTDTPVPRPPTPTPPPPPPPPPTDTPLPPPPPPQVGAHGIAGTMELRDGRTDYNVGEEIWFSYTAENKSGGVMRVGIVGIKASNGEFKSCWFGEGDTELPTSHPFSYPEHWVFNAPGTYTLKLAICFSTYAVCEGGGGDWEEFSPGLVVNVH